MKKLRILCLLLSALLLSQITAHAIISIEVGEDYEGSIEIIEETALDSAWLFGQLEDGTDQEQLLRDMLAAMYIANIRQQSPYGDEPVTLDSFAAAVAYISGAEGEPRRLGENTWQLGLSDESFFEIHTDGDYVVRVVFVLRHIESAFGGQLRVDIVS